MFLERIVAIQIEDMLKIRKALNLRAIFGVVVLAIGQYLLLWSTRAIQLNGWYEIIPYQEGGLYDLAGWILTGVGLYFIIRTAIRDGWLQPH